MTDHETVTTSEADGTTAASETSAAGGATANGTATGPTEDDTGTEPVADTVSVTVAVDRLTRLLDVVSAVVEECRLHFEPDGLRVVAADPAHVALTTVELDADGCVSYAGDGTTVGVDATRLAELLSVADDGQVTLALDPETLSLDVRLPGLSYTVAVIDPERVQEPPAREELSFPYDAGCSLPAAELDRLVRAVDLIGDYVRLGVDPDEPAFTVDADGDTDEVRLRYGPDDLPSLSPGVADSLFSLNYLADVSRVVPSDATVDLRLGEECPVRFEYDFADGHGSAETLVSPRLRK